ncbi:unnamed protein product [marine sediment metagenome]|uniref:Uncharacterized protein n=1 Tax=marine sediment metagenome TaxID=412755 RepID=X1AH14_9ZZZZ
MSGRHYFWAIVLLFTSCVSFFQRSEFKRGLDFYEKGDFLEASEYFNTYYVKHPESETTLYYLYDCYHKLNQPEKNFQVLQQFVKLGSKDENVYLNLFHYYQKNARYRDLYVLLTELKSPMQDKLDEYYGLTRGLYAEIVNGAFGVKERSDPMVFAISHGFLPVFPDNKFYDDDTITQGNLIILLDQLVAPSYPKKFFNMKHISNRSFIYLPYMRLVDIGVLGFNPELNPVDYATISMVVTALENLKRGGFIEY